MATFDKMDHLEIKYLAELIHDTALASLYKEFANIISAASLK